MTRTNLTLSPDNPPKFPKLIEQFMIHLRDVMGSSLENSPYAWQHVLEYDWLNRSERERVIAWLYNADQTSYQERLAGFMYAWTTDIYEVSEGLEKYVIMFPDKTYYDGSPIEFSGTGEVTFGKPVDKASKAHSYDDYETAFKVANLIRGRVEGLATDTNGHEWLSPEDLEVPKTAFTKDEQ